MKLLTILCFLVVLVSSSCSNNQESGKVTKDTIVEQPIDTIETGRKIFFENCVSCHNSMANDNLNVKNTKLSTLEIKKILSDSVTHNGLSFISLNEIEMIRKYLNQKAQY